MSWSETLGQVMQTRPLLAYGASYMGGVVATASPCILASIPLVIGFVGGMEVSLIKRFEAGYRAGAQAVRPGIAVLVNYAGVTPSAFRTSY